jgi:hypothetical protein
MAEYSRLAKGHFTSTGNAQVINLPFQPDRVEMLNYTLANSAATSQNIISAKWDVSMGQGFAVIEGYNATPALIYDVVSTGGISSFSAGLSLMYGPVVLLGGSGGIAKTDSSTLTVTTTAAHGLQPGNWVTFQNLYETSTTGMQQIAGIPFIVKTVGSTTTFTVSWLGNASNLTVIDGSATGAAGFKQILYPELYLPGVSFPWSITQSGTVVTVYTSAPTNYQVGQEIAFNLPSIYGGQNLNELIGNSNIVTPGKPVYFYVTAVGNVEVNSTYVDYFTFNLTPSLLTFNIAAPAFTSFPGLGFAQVKAVGDVNTGGYPYTGGNLYPSPTVVTTSGTATLGTTTTINGPAIQGAYINNTSQGFIIGGGAGRVLTTGKLVGASTNVIYWAAYLDDLSVN